MNNLSFHHCKNPNVMKEQSYEFLMEIVTPNRIQNTFYYTCLWPCKTNCTVYIGHNEIKIN